MKKRKMGGSRRIICPGIEDQISTKQEASVDTNVNQHREKIKDVWGNGKDRSLGSTEIDMTGRAPGRDQT